MESKYKPAKQDAPPMPSFGNADMSGRGSSREDVAQARRDLLHVVDVTALREVEREAQMASKAQSDLLATMSRELRTPLNAVIRYATLLLDTPLSNQQLDIVNDLHTAVDALHTRLSGILDRAEIEAGKLERQSTDPLLLATPAESEYQAPQPRILLAEDDPANQRLAALMLQRFGCRVDLATDGREAVSAVSRFPYDLVVMDCQMPELDGCAATGEIRKLPPPTGQVPIIALTANAFPADQQRCLSVGMNDFLCKPLTLESLQAVLKRWIPIHLDICETPSPESAFIAERPGPLAPDTLQDDLISIGQRRSEIAAILDEESARNSLRLFQEDWIETLKAAKTHLMAEDLEQLRRTAHRLIGSALELGAKALAQRCRRLESDAQRGDGMAATRRLADVEWYLRCLIAAL